MDAERFWILWAKKQSDELELSENEELERLITLVPANELSEEMLLFLWNAHLTPYPKDEPGAEVWSRIKGKIGESPVVQNTTKVRSLFARITAAAAVLLIIVAGWFVFRPAKHGEGDVAKMNKVTTRPDSKSQIELPDGTTVWLNKSSKLVYSNDFFGEKQREVTLIGEAFFDVKKNASLPFIINANDIKITVKGTAFNVKAYPESKTVQTALVRGLVEITTKKDPERKILLRPNEKFTFSVNPLPDNETVSQPASGEPPAMHSYSVTPLKVTPGIEPAETTWMNQRLSFNNETFEALAPRLESWYNLRVVFKNEKLKKVRFTGEVEKESIDELLKVLQLSSSFSYKINGDLLQLEL